MHLSSSVFQQLRRKTLNKGSIGLLASSIVLIIVMSNISPTFLTLLNLETIAMNYFAEGIMALGMTIIIICGEIDLSVGAIYAFSAVVVGDLLNAHLGIPLSILITLLVSGGLGFLNGLLMNLLNAQSFIVSLATMVGVGGLTLVASNGSTIYGFPQEFSFLGLGRIFGVPFPLLLFLFLAVVLGILLSKHWYVHQAYFVGADSDAARLCGIKPKKFRIFAFSLNGILAGIAGILVASYYTSASPTFGGVFGQDIMLRVIAAVIISGASLSGGKGSISATVLGVVFLALVNNIFIQAGLPTYWRQVIFGTIVIMAVISTKFGSTGHVLGKEKWQNFMLSSRSG